LFHIRHENFCCSKPSREAIESRHIATCYPGHFAIQGVSESETSRARLPRSQFLTVGAALKQRITQARVPRFDVRDTDWITLGRHRQRFVAWHVVSRIPARDAWGPGPAAGVIENCIQNLSVNACLNPRQADVGGWVCRSLLGQQTSDRAGDSQQPILVCGAPGRERWPGSFVSMRARLQIVRSLKPPTAAETGGARVKVAWSRGSSGVWPRRSAVHIGNNRRSALLSGEPRRCRRHMPRSQVSSRPIGVDLDGARSGKGRQLMRCIAIRPVLRPKPR